MPYDGSGNFLRVENWQADAAAGIKIRADRHDDEDDNFASGLSMVITKDGQTQPTNNIPMNGKKIVNMASPTAPTDAANKAYVDSIRTFSTAITLTGNDSNGSVHFTGTGNLGLRFQQADLSFGVKQAGNPASTVDRFVWMPAYDYSGTPLMELKRTGQLNFPGTSATFQLAGESKLQLSDAWGLLFAPSFYVQGRAGDAITQVIFRDSATITRGRIGVDQSQARLVMDYRNNAGAVQNTLELGPSGLYLGSGDLFFPVNSADILLGNELALTMDAAQTISYGPTLRVRARPGDTADNITLQDSNAINRAVLTADFANARTLLDYRNNAGVQQQSLAISAADGLRVGLGANAGVVITTGNAASLTTYQGNNASNLNYPVGESVIVQRGQNTARNEQVGVCLSSASTGFYEIAGAPNAGSQLPGTWNARGRMADFTFMATRTQ